MTDKNPLIVAIHGAGMHAGVWGGVVPHLLGYRIHALNLPGHTGTSTADDLLPTIDAMADFSGIFLADFGSDGPGGVQYNLSINGGDGTDSGVVDTNSGEKVILNLVGGEIIGSTEFGGLEVFRISVDLTGKDQL